jgi:hypothetical protein
MQECKKDRSLLAAIAAVGAVVALVLLIEAALRLR